MVRILWVVLMSSVPFASAQAGEVDGAVPGEIDPARHYILYSHGRIVEGTDPRPEHPRWGVYDFPAVAAALTGPNTDVIARHRPRGADPQASAQDLTGDVERLIAAGVAPNRITLVGFSQGGFITGLASNRLADSPVRTVIMAACWDWIERMPDVRITGDFLSIIERSDSVGSCERLATRSTAMTSFKEIVIDTGKEHGAFYQPLEAWVNPLKAWIAALVPAP